MERSPLRLRFNLRTTWRFTRWLKDKSEEAPSSEDMHLVLNLGKFMAPKYLAAIIRCKQDLFYIVDPSVLQPLVFVRDTELVEMLRVLAVRKENWVMDTLGHTLLRFAVGADGNSFSHAKSALEQPKFDWKMLLIKCCCWLIYAYYLSFTFGRLLHNMIASEIIHSNRNWSKTIVKIIKFEMTSWYLRIFNGVFAVLLVVLFQSILAYCCSIQRYKKALKQIPNSSADSKKKNFYEVDPGEDQLACDGGAQGKP